MPTLRTGTRTTKKTTYSSPSREHRQRTFGWRDRSRVHKPCVSSRIALLEAVGDDSDSSRGPCGGRVGYRTDGVGGSRPDQHGAASRGRGGRAARRRTRKDREPRGRRTRAREGSRRTLSVPDHDLRHPAERAGAQRSPLPDRDRRRRLPRAAPLRPHANPRSRLDLRHRAHRGGSRQGRDAADHVSRPP